MTLRHVTGSRRQRVQRDILSNTFAALYTVHPPRTRQENYYLGTNYYHKLTIYTENENPERFSGVDSVDKNTIYYKQITCPLVQSILRVTFYLVNVRNVNFFRWEDDVSLDK